MKLLIFLLVFIAGLALGIFICVKIPKIPAKLATVSFPQTEEDEPPPPPPPPSPEQINEVLSGSLALVEAQHTYYVHVTGNGRFAESVRELGPRDESGGTVMVLDVYNASDAVATPSPIHGYLFKILHVTRGADKKNGFVIVAYPADNQNDGQGWPIFLSFIPDAKGNLIGMQSRETWEIGDANASAKIRSLLQSSEMTLGELEKFSPENLANSSRIESFKKEIR